MDAIDIEPLVHPAAECFRLMHPDELESLAADIAAHGLRDPITFGRIAGETVGIVDGRNRHRACRLAGVEPRYVTIDFDDDEAVRAFVVSRNERRDITKGERAMALALVYPDGGKPAPGRRDPAATEAENTSVSMSRIKQARQVLRYNRELALAVRDGITKLDEAREIVQEAQTAVLSAEARMDRLRKEAPDLADLVTEERLSLAGAEAEANERLRVKRLTIEAGHRAAREIVPAFTAHVAAIVAARELGESVEVAVDKESQEQLRQAMLLLKTRRR